MKISHGRCTILFYIYWVMGSATGVWFGLPRALHPTARKCVASQNRQRVSAEPASGVASVCPEFSKHVKRVLCMGYFENTYLHVTSGSIRGLVGEGEPWDE